MSKISPWPWFYDGYHIMSAEDGISIHSVIDDVCISKADAKLIAAAPEMLDFLERARPWFLRNEDYEHAGKCLELIKKAKGE